MPFPQKRNKCLNKCSTFILKPMLQSLYRLFLYRLERPSHVPVFHAVLCTRNCSMERTYLSNTAPSPSMENTRGIWTSAASGYPFSKTHPYRNKQPGLLHCLCQFLFFTHTSSLLRLTQFRELFGWTVGLSPLFRLVKCVTSTLFTFLQQRQQQTSLLRQVYC